MRRVLFVDDEPHLLEGLRDALRSRRREWRMVFAEGPEQALAALEADAYDVVVSDMRMPVMDGAELLRRVRELQPHTVRIILTGYAGADRAAQAAPAAHRFCAKPCDSAELTAVISRSLALLDLARDQELRRSAVRAGSLPSAPEAYAELGRVLADPDAGAREAARIIARDTAMVGKILQLANSGFVGLRRRVTRLDEAVSFLGLEALRSLILAVQGFAAFPAMPAVEGFALAELGVRRERIARITAALVPDGPARDQAVTAALVHDIGLLVLATEEPDYLAEVLAVARAEDRAVADVEYAQRGVSHAEIGAYLLALWDLPHGVTETVAFHHRPRAAGDPVPPCVAALHVAEALADDPGAAVPVAQADGGAPWPSVADLERLGIAERLAHAREVASAGATPS